MEWRAPQSISIIHFTIMDTCDAAQQRTLCSNRAMWRWKTVPLTTRMGSTHASSDWPSPKIPRSPPNCQSFSLDVSYFVRSQIKSTDSSWFFLSATREGHYWLLDTDYETFATVYSCQMKDGRRVGESCRALPAFSHVKEMLSDCTCSLRLNYRSSLGVGSLA